MDKTYIKNFSPHKIILSDGTVITTNGDNEFDYDTIKKILEYEPDFKTDTKINIEKKDTGKDL